VIEEIPLLASEAFDIWSQSDQTFAGFEVAKCLGEGRLKNVLGGEMFEKVACKDYIEGVVWEGPRQATILLQKLNVAVDSVSAWGIEVHAILLTGLDIVDELPVPATEIEDRARHLIQREKNSEMKIRQTLFR
jgi:hypothetical protein